MSEYGILKPLFRGQAIQRDLIVRGWDDMHRISASLKDGTVTSVLLVAKLQALDNKNLIHRGLEEYGRLLKTIDILTFLSDKPYRRRIGRMLNKGEAVHSLARLVAYELLGVLTGPRSHQSAQSRNLPEPSAQRHCRLEYPVYAGCPVVRLPLSAACLELSVVNFVGGPNRP